jgi:predicted metal-dependent phosphoesterase TrpH
MSKSNTPILHRSNTPSSSFADLHLHTRYSDGSYTPAELVRAAAERNLATIALTDHDTFDGIQETLDAGRRTGVEVVPGVEITSRVDSQEVHILGYFNIESWRNPVLHAILDHAKKLREKRITQFVARFNELGFSLTVADVESFSTCGTIGRPHVAQALVKRGVVKSVEEAFERFLKFGKPGYVERPRMTAAETLGHIRRAGGVAVLAHPGLNNIDDRLHELKQQGLAGLEVWHPKHTAAKSDRYLKLAEKLGLLPTGGSDCHGNVRGEPAIGSVRLPHERVEELKKALNAGVYQLSFRACEESQDSIRKKFRDSSQARNDNL